MSLTDRLSRNTGAWKTPQRRPHTASPETATPTRAAQPAPSCITPPAPSPEHTAQRPIRPTSHDATGEEYYTVKAKLHQRLIERIDLAAVERLDPEELGRRIAALVERILAEEFRQAPLNMAERQRIISEMRHEVLGLGPLEPLLQDPAVSDILVNGYAQVYVERRGKLERTDTRFQDDAHLRQIIERIVSRMGRRIDESSPMVDARLEDGSRVNAIIPPLAIDGPSLSIRRFSRDPLEMDDLIAFNALTKEIGDVLRGIVRARLNILISGGTGSGKTTLLNVLSRFVPHDERIVTIEDAAELQLKQDHVVRLETRPANLEGRGEITARDLVKNCLRMRPDRIIVGEVRGAEVLDMLQAMNTGHDGSLTTVHANTPRDALMRIETMTAMAGLNLTGESTKRTIASAIDVIIQATRLGDGTRKLISVQEITGMEGPAITMQEIFRFRQTGVTATRGVRGVFESMGIRPKFAQRLSALGVELDADLFRAGTLLSVGEDTP
ncbi:CpaF family protein [Desulfobaculum senezii]